MGAFFMGYMGKWVRRSNVMTAAEWMETRFGSGFGGRLARTTSALIAVIFTVCFIGYAFQGIGKFAAVFVPLEKVAEHTSSEWLKVVVTDHEAKCLAVVVIAITTLYVILGGLYSVVVTDCLQTVILTIGSIFVAYIAWSKLSPEALASVPDGWASLRVPWKIPELAGTEDAKFVFFGGLVIVWVVKGLLVNLGGPAQMYDAQRFLATRNARDAAKVGAAWSLFLVVRWAMCAGIALLAITGITHVTDSEKVMPLVLQEHLTAGVRGVVLAGLLAAFMSTFSSTVNSGASFIVRDIWQVYYRREATEKEAVRFSYVATIMIVVTGVVIGFNAKSIAAIWNWMMMALSAGVVIPNVLRWYWWRINGYGYAFGTFAGIILSLIALFRPDAPIIVFATICGASVVAMIAGSLMTKAVERETLVRFYSTVRPFGVWGAIRRAADLSDEEPGAKSESTALIALNVVLGMIAIACIYIGPMYLVGHWYGYAGICFAISAVACVVLAFTWYRNLPED